MDELLVAVRAMVQEVVRDELRRVTLSQDDPSGQYLTTSQAAMIARATPGTIRRWTREGRLTKHTTGHRVLVSRAELEGLIRVGRRVVNRSVSPSPISPEARARAVLEQAAARCKTR